LSRKRVLVADDNDGNRELARQCLTDGFDVLLAPDGVAALEQVRSARPDLVLLDLSMPRMNGWDVARALKADPSTKAISLVACTAHAMSGDRERALAVGFDGYLAKPYRPRELVSCVEDFLGPGVPNPGSSEEWTIA
jgi:two-component system cell cycle response regulator DivK